MFRALSLSLFATALGLAAVGSAQAATVHLADIVSDPVAVNDFELAPEFRAVTWTQQGIRATQMDGTGEVDAIWLASGLGLGVRSWYPNGGDDGWTRLTLDSGNNFDAISFFGGSGWLQPPQTMYFELAANGMLVLSGTLAATFAGSWYGFAGGDFDEVRLRASGGNVGSLTDCPVGPPGPNNGCNFAWVDEIRVGAARSVSEPGSVALVLVALFLLSRFARRPGAPSGVRASLCAATATTSGGRDSTGPMGGASACTPDPLAMRLYLRMHSTISVVAAPFGAWVRLSVIQAMTRLRLPMNTSPLTGWGIGAPSGTLHGPNPSGRWVTEV